MPVNPENFFQEFLAKAVHHRHDDDECGNAEHDADEEEPGNDGNQPFFTPRSQIAQRCVQFRTARKGACRSARTFRSGPRRSGPREHWEFHTILAESRSHP